MLEVLIDYFNLALMLDANKVKIQREFVLIRIIICFIRYLLIHVNAVIICSIMIIIIVWVRRVKIVLCYVYLLCLGYNV